MIELVQRYYTGERQTALLGIALGVGLIVATLLLWRRAAAASVGRGAAYVLVVAGLAYVALSGGYIVVAAGRAADAAALYAKQPERAVADQEATRVRDALQSAFARPLEINTALLVVGVILVVASRAVPVRKGIGLALMIVGIAGLGLEAFSIQKHRHYAQDIKTWSLGAVRTDGARVP